MCGITGFVGRGTLEDIRRMTATLVHRGPDGVGFFQDLSVHLFFGHRRLSIREIEHGRQPMGDDDGITVIFNGEIYNYEELKEELERKGHRFRHGHSDTEVLVWGYKEWGSRLPEKLNGMWAFAVHDRGAQRLFLSRDRFGEKPLFVTQQNGVFAFASELKALRRHPELRFDVSTLGVQKYMAHGYLPGDHTIYRNIRKLPAGSNLALDLRTRRVTETRYWSYEIEPDPGRSESYWIKQVQERLFESVKRRLVSDVPLGLFLSGGLDSSAVGCFARQALSADVPLHSFSLGFEEATFDETPVAREVARLLGTAHSSTTFSADRVAPLMEGLFTSLDEPVSDSSMMSYYLLCQHARKGIMVALGGDAGDELFAGYDTFRAMKMASAIEPFFFKPVHRAVLLTLGRFRATHSYMPFQFKVKRLLTGFGHPKSVWNALWLGPVSTEDISELMQTPVSLEELYSEAIDTWDLCRQSAPVDKTLAFYGNLFLPDQILVKVDRLSMMHSLEVRTPFLDIDLVNVVRRIPHTLKLRGFTQPKYILKKALEEFLPKHIVWRKKIGFSAPLGKWFSDGSIGYDGIESWNAGAREVLGRKVREHRELKSDHRLLLWNTFVLNRVINSQQMS